MQLQSSLLRPAFSPSPAPNTSFPLLPLRGLPRFSPAAGGKHRVVPARVGVVCGNLGDRWKLSNIDRDAVQERLSSWLLKAQTLITDVAVPLVKPGQGRMPKRQMEPEKVETKDLLMAVPELTIERKTPNGKLSIEAAISVEQFSRMVGLTGRKMQKIFEAQAPEPIRNDARSFVEYCCFRYLSRDNSDVHPSLKEPAFQRLIFLAMLAWEKPYCEDGHQHNSLENYSLQVVFLGP
ncbi:hypothetical protein Taro_001507 [Colocasia esculenta]|uniref:Uncharacterized protein n=1 Tax=Colocasia esculenta TaxID=4460 RepID=A0A843TKU3_COLES|nr:hypothetical protein [Colocasia esculenta]